MNWGIRKVEEMEHEQRRGLSETMNQVAVGVRPGIRVLGGCNSTAALENMVASKGAMAMRMDVSCSPGKFD